MWQARSPLVSAPWAIALSLGLGLSVPLAPWLARATETPDPATKLWSAARSAFAHGQNASAEIGFEDYLKKYPGSPHHLEAHLYLGLSRIRLGKLELAKKPLKAFIEVTDDSAEAHRARLTLARVEIDTRGYRAALLWAIEVLREKAPGAQPLQTEALIVKSWALMGLHQAPDARSFNDDLQAREALDAAVLRLKSKSDTALLAEAHRARQELKLRKCRRLPKPGPVEEGVLRSALLKRGTCWSEALVSFFHVLEQNEEHWAIEALQAQKGAYLELQKLVDQPPPPPGRRTAEELKRYYAEIAQILRKDFSETRDQARRLIATWEKKISNSSRLQLSSLSKVLEAPHDESPSP